MLFGYESMDLEGFQRVLNLNVIGTMLSIKYTLPAMVEAGGGSFVGMSSLAGLAHRVRSHPGVCNVAGQRGHAHE